MPQSDLARYTEQLSGLIETRSPSFIVANIDKIVSLNGIVSGFLSRMENYERPGGERVCHGGSGSLGKDGRVQAPHNLTALALKAADAAMRKNGVPLADEKPV